MCLVSGEEVQGAAGGELRDPLAALGEQLAPTAVELAVQQADQLQRPRGQDLVEPIVHGAGDLDALRRVHARSLAASGVPERDRFRIVEYKF